MSSERSAELGRGFNLAPTSANQHDLAVSGGSNVKLWLASTVIMVALHGGALATALYWKPEPKMPPAEVDAIMIELAPLAPPPQPEKKEAKPEEPKPEPPKPEPKPEPKPKPKPKPKPETVRKPEVVDPTSQEEYTPQVATPPPAAKPSQPSSAVQTQQQQMARQSYLGTVAAHLERHKQYPRSAQQRRQQGICVVTFKMNRAGEILGYRIIRQSGHAILDREAEDLLHRAAPLPKPPDTLPDNVFEITVPINFFIRR